MGRSWAKVTTIQVLTLLGCQACQKHNRIDGPTSLQYVYTSIYKIAPTRALQILYFLPFPQLVTSYLS